MSYINDQFENIRNFNIYKEKTMCKELVYFISGTKNITAYDSNPISKKPNSMEYFSSYNSSSFPSKSKYQKKEITVFEILVVSKKGNLRGQKYDLLKTTLNTNVNVNNLLTEMRIEFVAKTGAKMKNRSTKTYTMGDDLEGFGTEFPVDTIVSDNDIVEKKTDYTTEPYSTLLIVVAAGGIFYFYQILSFLQYRKIKNIVTENHDAYYNTLLSLLYETNTILDKVFSNDNIFTKSLVDEYNNLIDNDVSKLFKAPLFKKNDLNLCSNDDSINNLLFVKLGTKHFDNAAIKSFITYYKKVNTNCLFTFEKLKKYNDIQNSIKDIELSDTKNYIIMTYIESTFDNIDSLCIFLFGIELPYDKLKNYITNYSSVDVTTKDVFESNVIKNVIQEINKDKKYKISDNDIKMYKTVAGKELENLIKTKLLIFKIKNGIGVTDMNK